MHAWYERVLEMDIGARHGWQARGDLEEGHHLTTHIRPNTGR